MSNNKQSSVEWLVQQLGKYNEEMIFLYQNEIKQAKAMHKEEQRRIYGKQNFDDNGRMIPFEEFYNERFGGNK
jgi:hypothetical protein